MFQSLNSFSGIIRHRRIGGQIKQNAFLLLRLLDLAFDVNQTKIIGIIDESIVAFGTSNPLSIMVVDKTSNSPS
jgi:hypothetical protein